MKAKNSSPHSQENRTVLEQEKVQQSCIQIYQHVYKLIEKFKESSEPPTEKESLVEEIGLLDKENIAAYIYSKLRNLGKKYEKPLINFFFIH